MGNDLPVDFQDWDLTVRSLALFQPSGPVFDSVVFKLDLEKRCFEVMNSGSHQSSNILTLPRCRASLATSALQKGKSM